MRITRGTVLAVVVSLLVSGPAASQTRVLSGGDTATATALSSAFRSAASRVMPAVVFIAVEQRSAHVPPQLREFFGGDSPHQPGTGSGFLIDAQGHILTNNHVVADASRLTVRLTNGREYTARVVGSDVSTDLAVIKIEPRDGERFASASFADSDGVRVGDWVLALGSPLGLEFTVTAGIVSAHGRQISGQSTLEAYIQTDAAINPGNSGGPLIDLYGRVVGVNSAIFGMDRFVGYGFAVPSNLARRVMGDLLEFGYLRRPRLGVRVVAVQAAEAEVYGLREVRGAFIAAVEPQGPAGRAGVRAGDIILSLNGQPLRNDTDMITRLTDMRPESEVMLGVHREGAVQQIRVRLGEFERPVAPAPHDAPAAPENAEELLGFSVRELTDAERERLDLDDGVIVTRSAQYSAAWTNGIRENSVIIAINGKRVDSADDVREVAESVRPGGAVSVTLYNRDYGEFVVVYRTRD